MNKYETTLLADLHQHRGQSSWDYEADYRFAKALGWEKETEDLKSILGSRAPFTCIIAAHTTLVGHVKKLRVSTLRTLAKEGYVEAFWVGMGSGGGSTFGVNRARAYVLTEEGKRAALEIVGEVQG